MLPFSTLLLIPILALPRAEAPPTPVMPDVLSQWTLTELSVPTELPEAFSFEVALGGVPMTVSMHRHTIRAHDFEVLVADGTGALTPYDPPPARTYRGAIVGDAASQVSGSLLDNGLSAMIRLGSGDTWMIEPVSSLTDSIGDSRYVIYRASDVLPTDHFCGTDMQGDGIGGQGGQGGIASDTPSWVTLGVETDYEFFQKNGSNVNTTITDIEMVLNGVDGVFNTGVDISYEITVIIVRSDVNDPYTAGVIGDRLCQFRSTWNSAPESSISRSIGHMFSGVAYGGGTIGVAWLGTACNANGNVCGAGVGNVAYSIVESKYLTPTPLFLRISLSAHELGHNWGATHCDGQGAANCHIMCSTNNGCGGVGGTNLKLDPLSINEINAYQNTVTCDPVIAAPLSLPFLDTFPVVTVNSTHWIFNKGGIINATGVSEPSPTLSLTLDSVGNNDFQDDEIRSNKMLLAGLGAVKFSYWTQRINVEAGKSLSVDYFNSSGKWININTIVSDGVNQNSYTLWEHVLPANAKHNGFRIRFKTNGDDGTDDWYIDDVKVAVVPPCPADYNGNQGVDGGDLAILLGVWGTNSPANDLNGDGTINGADLSLLLGSWGPCPA